MIANDVLQKRCRTCGDEFPATTEFFYRNKGCTDGLLGQCKACIGEKAKVYRKRIEENRQAPAAERRCTACGNIFPGTAEFFGRKKESIDGLNTQCKACWNAKTLAHQKEVDQRHPEVRERRLAWHRAHYRHPERHEHKLAWRKEYESRPEVQEHRRVWSKAYYNSRPDVQERRRARAKAYEGRPDVQARLKAYRKAYNRRPEVRERYIARENRPDRQAYRKAYKSRPDTQSHRLAYYKSYNQLPERQDKARERRRRPDVREYERIFKHNLRARKRTIPGIHTPAQIQEMLKRHHRRCYYCRARLRKNPKRIYGYEFHIDHTFPLSRVAGTDIPANDISYLVPACPTCNVKKSDKYPWEFAEGGRLL